MTRLPAPGMPGLMVAVCLLGLLGSLGGCARPLGEAGEEDHLEHHVPPHRPADFAAGLREVRQRVAELDAGAGQPYGAETATRVTELGEILEWLPDLALDSDIRRADWEQIHAISVSLLVDYRQAVAGRGGRPGEGLGRQFAQRLEQLSGLADRVREDPPPGEGMAESAEDGP